MKRIVNYSLADWIYKPASACLAGKGETRQLTPQQNRLLMALVQAEERTLSRDALVEIAWNRSVVSDDAIARAISDLRKVLRTDSFKEPIRTLHGFGYKLQTEVKTAPTPFFPMKLIALAATAVLLGIAGVLVFRSSSPPLVSVAVTPMTVFNQLNTGNHYLPAAGRLTYLSTDSTGSAIIVEEGGIPNALVRERILSNVEVSPNGESLALLDLTEGCQVRVVEINGNSSNTLGPCLAGASPGVAWTTEGNVLYGQLSDRRISVYEYLDGRPEIEVAEAPDCVSLGHLQRGSDGRTFVSCTSLHGDVLYEMGGGTLTELLRYREIEKFVIDNSDYFYLLHAPRWKTGITRFVPPDSFEFLHTGWVLDVAVNSDRLVMVRDLTNPDIMVLDLQNHVSRPIEESPVRTQAFTIDGEGYLWQIDDREGDVALYFDGRAHTVLDQSMLDFDFADVACIAVDAAAGTIMLSAKPPDGRNRVATHHLETGALLRITTDLDGAACPRPLPSAIAKELQAMGHAPHQALLDAVRNQVFYITDRSSYRDVAIVDLAQLPDL